jgi:hypothetical protein
MKKNVKLSISNYEKATNTKTFVTFDNSKYNLIAHNTLTVLFTSKSQDDLKRQIEEVLHEQNTTTQEEEKKQEENVNILLATCKYDITLDESLKIININDIEYSKNLYKISLYNYSSNFHYVYANDAQTALDTLVDYLEEQNTKGHFYTYDELINNYMLTCEEIEQNYMTAGNYCRYIDIEHLNIIEIENIA